MFVPFFGQAESGGGSFFDSGTILFFVIIIGIFYLLVLRPQQKKEQQRRGMLEALKKNQRVVTIGQMVGVIMSIKGNEIILKVDDTGNTRIRMLRTGIARVLGNDEDLTGAAEEAGRADGIDDAESNLK